MNPLCPLCEHELKTEHGLTFKADSITEASLFLTCDACGYVYNVNLMRDGTIKVEVQPG